MASTPQANSDEIDKLRIKVNGAIVAFSMIVLLVVISLVLLHSSGTRARRRVRRLPLSSRSVTTFLSAVVGLVFGIHAGQVGASTAVKAANIATQAGELASNVASSASRMLTAQSYSRAESAPLTPQMRSGIMRLHTLASTHDKPGADFALKSIAPDLDTRASGCRTLSSWSSKGAPATGRIRPPPSPTWDSRQTGNTAPFRHRALRTASTANSAHLRSR